MNVNFLCQNASPSVRRLRSFNQWTLPVLVLLALLCGMTASTQAQTALFAGTTTAINTTFFTEAQGIAQDASGNIYVAGTPNSGTTWGVYELTPNGSGGYNTPTPLPFPSAGTTYPCTALADPCLRGVVLDSNGNLWVAEYNGGAAGTVYEYTPTAGVFSTAPTTVGTTWTSPWGLAADTAGNVFVADGTNVGTSANTISEITGGTVTVLNTGGITQPRGIAVDPTTENLFVVNGNASQVQELAATGYTTVTTLNTGTDATFNGPGLLARDGNGNLWVSDYGAYLVGELTGCNNLSGQCSNALTWGSGLNSPVGVGLGNVAGTVLVTDQGGGIFLINDQNSFSLGSAAVGSTSATTQTVTFAFSGGGSTTIAAPQVVTFGGGGKDFTASANTCTAGAYATLATCTVTVSFTPTAPGNRAGAVILVNGSGTELAQAFFTGTATGPQLTFEPGKGTSALAAFTAPQKIAVDGAGDVFVVDSATSTVTELIAGGGTKTIAPTTATIPTTSAPFSSPQGIAIDGAGNLFVSESGNNRVDEIYAPDYTIYTPLPYFSGTLGDALDASGNLYVADGALAVIDKLTVASGYGSETPIVTSGLDKPFDVAVDPNNNIWVADFGGGANGPSVKEFNSAGALQHTYTGFSSPEGIATDAAGNVYVADNGGGTITELVAANSYAAVTLASATSTPAVSDPTGVAVDNKGNVYYTDDSTTDTSAYEIDLADPPTLSFATSLYETQTDPTQTVTLSNVGVGANLTLTNIVAATTSGSTANSFAIAGSSTCSSTSSLAGGATCALGINYIPQSVGTAIVGTATVSDNVGTGSQVIDLNGAAATAATATVLAANATAGYSTTSQTVTLTATVTATGIAEVNEGTVAFTVLGTTGGTVTSPTVVNGAASVTYTIPAGQAAGAYTIQAVYTDASGGFTTSTDTTHTLTIGKVAPTITWASPASIVYGTALTATQLDASSTVAGTYVYTPAAGTVLNAGANQTLSVTFTPTDTTDYTTATATTTITVTQATPTITWAAPASIVYGTALSGTQLDASSPVAGTFVYTPAAGTVLHAGANQTLSVTLTPTDTTDYKTATATTTITVTQATPTITWATPASIVYGTPLSATQLDASSTVAGTYVYTPVAGTVLHAGTGQTLSVTLTPTDTTDYTTATATTTITVTQATPTITWAAPASIVYGTALSASQLDASSTVAGTYVYTPAAGTVLHAGANQTLSVTLTPTDTTDYATATATTTITVTQATPTITWASPASIVYGTALSATQLDASSTAAGNFTYTPAAGTVLPVGANQTLSVSFAPTDATDYLPSTKTVMITVSATGLTVTANSATRVYGVANPTFTGTITGAQNGDTFTESFTTTATTASNAGTYPIVPSASGTDLADYTVVINDGTLTITKANSTISLSASGSSVNPGAPVTLTATVASATTGTPTGSVSFYDGTTLLATSTLSGGAATYSTTTLAAGVSHTLTAVYSGDINFNSSNTTTSTDITVGVLDFTLGTPSPATQTGSAGTAFTYSFGITPTYGTYAGTVNFAATGLPAGAAATFSPSSIPATGGSQTVTMIVNTVSQNAALVRPSTTGRGLIPIALAFLFLPLAGTKRMRREGRRLGRLACLLLLVLAGLGATAALTGCGSHSGMTTNSQSYTVTITATSGSIQHTATVTLDLQQ